MTTQQPAAQPMPMFEEIAEAEAAVPMPELLTLPVIVMDETVLMPHMSLPLPIEDDETAAAIAAAPAHNRLALLVTERPIPSEEGEHVTEAGEEALDEE